MPQCISRVVKGRHGHDPASQAHPHRQKPPLYPPFGRRPEHHCQHSVSRRRRNEQHPGIHIRIEDTSCHGHAAGKKSQSQHTPGHGAGECEKQQRQPRQLLLPAESRQRQQDSRRDLHRGPGQKGEPWEKHCRRIGASQQRSAEIPSPPQGPSR